MQLLLAPASVGGWAAKEFCEQGLKVLCLNVAVMLFT